MANDSIIKDESWRARGYDETLSKADDSGVSQAKFISGSSFDALLDEMLFSRMIRLKGLPAGQKPQGNDPGKIYWDKDNKKYKLWVDKDSQWVDVQWTSTSTTSSSSTSTTSSSTSSTSTSSTSHSTSSSTSTTHT